MNRAFAIQILLITALAQTTFLIPELQADVEQPTRTWFFHARIATFNNPATFSMNEQGPEISSTDPSVGGQDSIMACAYFGFATSFCGVGTSVTFTLSPTYPSGFDILKGTVSLDIWMRGDVGSQGNERFTGPASFNFRLMGPSGELVGTKDAIVMIPPWEYSSNPGPSGWNHTVVSMPIPEYFSTSPNSPISLRMTWLNAISTGGIFFAFNTASRPSNVRVPADYYTSQLTLRADEGTVRLGETIRLYGNLLNTWNGSGIAGQAVTLTAHWVYRWQDPTIPIAEVITTETGAYVYDWSPNTLGDFRIEASWPGNRHFKAASSLDSGQAVLDIPVKKAFTGLTMEVSPWFSLTAPSLRLHGSLQGLEGPIEGADVVIAFKVPGSDSWNIIASSKTDPRGNYETVWTPHATGDFSLRATWVGDAEQDVGEATASIRVPAFDLAWNVPTWFGLSGLGIAAAVFVWKRRIHRPAP